LIYVTLKFNLLKKKIYIYIKKIFSYFKKLRIDTLSKFVIPRRCRKSYKLG